jgi:hypothetical protein
MIMICIEKKVAPMQALRRFGVQLRYNIRKNEQSELSSRLCLHPRSTSSIMRVSRTPLQILSYFFSPL